MKKISGIIPASTRVTTVDLKNSGVARPGMPTFGRVSGISAAEKREKALAAANLSEAETPDFSQRALAAHANQMSMRNVSADQKADIAKRITDSFFNTKLQKKDPEVDMGLDETNDMRIDLASKPVPLNFHKDSAFDSDINLNNYETHDYDTRISDAPNAHVARSLSAANQNDFTENVDEDAPATGQYLDVQA